MDLELIGLAVKTHPFTVVPTRVYVRYLFFYFVLVLFLVEVDCKIVMIFWLPRLRFGHWKREITYVLKGVETHKADDHPSAFFTFEGELICK